MEKYEVKITDEALKDMEKIYDYIANSYAIAIPKPIEINLNLRE